MEVVGVRFKQVGKRYYFSPNGNQVKRCDDVIVETARGIEFGKAITDIKNVDDSEIILPLKPIIRVATDEDRKINEKNLEKAKRAHQICIEKIKEHKLDMKMIFTEYTFDNNKILFYFTADDRIDFRELVKDLANIFRTRIELRQIGVRDEVKFIGSIGFCGRETCCTTHLCEFNPVTIKMAKDQSFSLNPSKISGICGRLMCCLAYEQETYEYFLKKMPKVGSEIITKKGKGIVQQISPLQEMLRVKYEIDDEITIENISLDEIEEVSFYPKDENIDDISKEIE